MRGTREGNIIGGALLLLIDAYGLVEGRIPLKGRLETVNMTDTPELFMAYSIGLGVIGLAAILWGLTRDP
jgi:hypothetical protein